MKIHVIILAAVLFFCASGLFPAHAALSSKGPTAPPAKNFTYAYFPTAVPVAVIAEVIKRDSILQRELAKQGTNISFQPFTKGNDVIALIAANKIAAVAMSDMPTIETAINGNIQILGIVKQSYASIIAPKGALLRDLRGKKIGNAFGSTSHYALLQALRTAGLSDKDVFIVPLDVNEMPEALAQKKIDAFAAWEPAPTAALQKYPGRFTSLHKQVSFSYFMITQQLLEQSPQAAEKLVAAMVRAIRWLKKDNSNLILASRWTMEGMQTFTGKSPSLTDQDIARITRDDLLDVPGAPLIPYTDKAAATPLSHEFEFLKKIGKLPENSAWEKVHKSINSNLLRKILANPKKFALNRFDYRK